MSDNIKIVSQAIEYIEQNLNRKIDLERVAYGVNYSKYHLHRTFTKTVNLTIHDYIQRRKLTEAARLLVFTDKSILEIALVAGYESQQAFSSRFKALYKKSPSQFRANGEFYPLQLKFVLSSNPSKLDFKRDITLARKTDIPIWMDLVRLVIDGFPNLIEEEYLMVLDRYIDNLQALILKDHSNVVGVMMFNQTGRIDFLGIHPQYPKRDVIKAFINKLLTELSDIKEISITTFREGDKADLGYRSVYKSLGFEESGLLVEFGYPTQELVLKKNDGSVTLMINIERWMDQFVAGMKKAFGNRIEFIGLQGSRGRGEANDDSDIDIVLILDELTTEDLKIYEDSISKMAHRDKVCGFISGKKELMNWEKSDLFQFYYDTMPILGNIDYLLPIKIEDVRRAIHTGACNIYHMCAHNRLHEKDTEILKSLYKSASFVIQAIYYTQTKTHLKKQTKLLPLLSVNEKEILETYLYLKQLQNEEIDFNKLSDKLFNWAGQLIRGE